MSMSNAQQQTPLSELRRLLARVQRSGVREPDAAMMATADAQGRPSVRTVLIRGVDERGLVFYTNGESRKAAQLRANPHAALCIYSDALRLQILIEGRVERVADEDVDAYWVRRPRLSQLGAWASSQSRPLPNRRTLLARLARVQLQYAGRPVPRPAYWVGFRVIPGRIEFWRSRPYRLHERVLYERRGHQWIRTLLYP